MSGLLEATNPKASKIHRCTYCGEFIPIGERYHRWVNYDGGQCISNKVHNECLEDLQDSEEHEYLLYQNERPRK